MKTVVHHEGDYYVAGGGERLEDIAKETGTPYMDLVYINPQYKDKKIPKGTAIRLDRLYETSDETRLNEKQRYIAETLGEAEKETEKEEESREKEEAKQKAIQLKREEYNAKINNAEKDYLLNANTARDDYSERTRKLANTLYKNRTSLESNLAKQKISDSSIADNSRARLETEAQSEQQQAARSYDAKIEKLKNTLNRTREEQNRKLRAL